MKNKGLLRTALVLISVVLLSFIIEGYSSKNTSYNINTKNKNADNINFDELKNIKVGFCQSTPDAECTGILYYTLMDLQAKGIISGMSSYQYKPFKEDGQGLWKYVCENVTSKYITFVDDFYYDLEKDKPEQIMKRLKSKDINLMITYGTRSGNEFFNDQHDVNIINFGSNDPVKSGFVQSKDNSGRKNLWAHIDTQKYYNQIKLFYNNVHFKKLGVVEYSDSFRKVFTPTEDIEKLKNELGYDYHIYSYYNIEKIYDVNDKSEYYDRLRKMYEKISEECDAFYMVIGGWSYEDLNYLLEPFIEKNIPVFSQFGSIEVKNGALMSVGKIDFSDIGGYLSSVITKILSGTDPGDIPQEYIERVGVAINMKVAKQINFKPSLELIINSDEIYN